ncbi:MAG: hypothetical protein CSA58_11505 [Micrococcales bacterium]|nr:MAG: hypothetical protein CSB46_02375 [Micrococcales bacterium]PIE26079.1 MAG: hypothetical protein CSA58_11505 [Micrococcales bacterium]
MHTVDATTLGVADRLFAVAMEQFVANGYDNVTTTDIAEAAGVSQRTLFRHYPTKMDLLLRDTQASTDEFFALLASQPARLPLHRALAAAIAQQSMDPAATAQAARLSAVIRDATSLRGFVVAYLQQFERRLAAWIAERQGLQPEDFRARTAAAMLTAARRVTMEEWHRIGSAPEAMMPLVEEALTTVDLIVATGVPQP